MSREQVYRIVGERTRAEQRVALGAHRTATLSSLIQTCITVTPDHARYAEQCTFPARHLYATENLFVGQQIVQLDVVPNTWMRAPGESIGTFALESALDELSYALGMDPIDVRRLNEPSDVPLQLPTPRDPRARRPAESVRSAPDGEVSIETLSRDAGASRRTMERLFLAETGMTVDEWRRRFRLLHGMQLLARADSVTTPPSPPATRAPARSSPRSRRRSA